MNTSLRPSTWLGCEGRAAAALALLAVFATLTACNSNEPDSRVTEQEAAALLTEAVEYGQEFDWDTFCLLTGDDTPRGSCLDEISSSLLAEQFPFPRANPSPEVVGSRRLSESELVLELCVTSEAGKLRSDFYVLRYRGELIAPYPVYWIPRGIADSSSHDGVIRAGPTPPPSGVEWRQC